MKKMILSILICMSLLSILSVKVDANASLPHYGIPYQTYTLDAQKRLIPTQTAYIPVGTFGRNLGLNQPEDFYVLNDIFYIADAGSKRILLMDRQGQYIDEVQINEFVLPTGVFVKDGFLYVADKSAKSIFKIDLVSKTLVETFGKPISPIFGAHNDFVPLKVAVDSSDSMYVIGEGSTSGVIQLNYAGEFIGYLGINTVPLSLRRILYQFFVRDSSLASSLPASPTNISIGQKGSILTTNVNVFETFKRLNISGVNTLSSETYYPSIAPTDVFMSDEGYIYLVSENGDVFEYDQQGKLLFHFNTRDVSLTQSLGLNAQPKAIMTDHLGFLYVLDKGYNQISVYQRTVFVDLVHEAVTLYNDGRYLESKPLWEEILRQNSSFALAHSAMGQSLSKEGRYEEALSSFYDARDYKGYSDTFWEIRNAFIQTHLSLIIIVSLSGFVFYKGSYSIFKKSHAYEGYIKKKETVMSQKTIQELLYGLTIFKRPMDVLYGIKRKSRASYLSGLIVFASFILVYLLNTYLTGFLFRNPNLNHISLQFLIVFSVFMLYVIVNYLVSTLNDGEGRFKDVFIATSYALLPYIILTLPMTLISNYLTYNESFIFDFYHQLILWWTILWIFISVKGIHNYTFWETVKNLLIIIFGMFIVILIGLLIYAFMGQLIEFIISVFREVIYRV